MEQTLPVSSPPRKQYLLSTAEQQMMEEQTTAISPEKKVKMSSEKIVLHIIQYLSTLSI